MSDTTFQNGDKVRVKDGDSEIFTVSQAMDSKCWIGDSQGRGWYIYYDRLELVEEEETCEFCGETWNECECDTDEDDNRNMLKDCGIR